MSSPAASRLFLRFASSNAASVGVEWQACASVRARACVRETLSSSPEAEKCRRRLRVFSGALSSPGIRRPTLLDHRKTRACTRVRRIVENRVREGAAREPKKTAMRANDVECRFFCHLFAFLAALSRVKRRRLFASDEPSREGHDLIGANGSIRSPGAEAELPWGRNKKQAEVFLHFPRRARASATSHGVAVAAAAPPPSTRKKTKSHPRLLPLLLLSFSSLSPPLSLKLPTQARAAANAAASSVGKKSATSAAAAVAPSASAPVSLPKTFVRRSAPGCKESQASHVKEASAPRGSLWEKMFF